MDNCLCILRSPRSLLSHSILFVTITILGTLTLIFFFSLFSVSFRSFATLPCIAFFTFFFPCFSAFPRSYPISWLLVVEVVDVVFSDEHSFTFDILIFGIFAIIFSLQKIINTFSLCIFFFVILLFLFLPVYTSLSFASFYFDSRFLIRLDGSFL